MRPQDHTTYLDGHTCANIQILNTYVCSCIHKCIAFDPTYSSTANNGHRQRRTHECIHRKGKALMATREPPEQRIPSHPQTQQNNRYRGLDIFPCPYFIDSPVSWPTGDAKTPPLGAHLPVDTQAIDAELRSLGFRVDHDGSSVS